MGLCLRNFDDTVIITQYWSVTEIDGQTDRHLTTADSLLRIASRGT